MGLETLQGQRDRAKLKWWYQPVSVAEISEAKKCTCEVRNPRTVMTKK